MRTSSGTNGNYAAAAAPADKTALSPTALAERLNNFLLDGIDNNSNDNGGVVLRTNVDAIQEFKLQTNSYSAEFGRSGGAVVNAIIKSGTNHYHGNVFEFFRNSALDARDYFEPPTDRKASYKQNQFGGTLGGPTHQRQAVLVRRLSGNAHPQSTELELRCSNGGGTQRRFFCCSENRSSTIRQLACHSREI